METVNVVLYKHLNVSLDTENSKYLKDVYKHFEHFVKDYRFSPKFQSGQWNGKKSFFRKSSRSLPYGLLTRLIRYTKNNWKDINLSIDPAIKEMYKGIDVIPEWNLLYTPHYYQEEVILSALKTSKGIFSCPTASGKSLIISYITREIINFDTEQALIIVPTIGLVHQFKEDMIDYGIDKSLIGMVDKDHSEWDNRIVVSTWQSLANNEQELQRFNMVVVDEVHGVRGDILHNLLKEMPETKWRFGFTGTMPNDTNEALQVESYIGPVLKSYKSSVLAEEGYIATCTINMLNINYRDNYTGDFNTIKNGVFDTMFRKNIIKSIVKNVKGSILLLVDKVELEGRLIERYLNEQKDLGKREIVFIHGKMDAENRSYWQKRINEKKNIIAIATFGVFQMGINIKSLRYAVLCSSFKSNIRVLQSIGRTLRKHPDKEGKGAIVFDLNDQVKILEDHGKERANFYEIEGFRINDIDIIEGQPCVDFKQLC